MDTENVCGIDWVKSILMSNNKIKVENEADLACLSADDWETIADCCHTGHDWCELLELHPQSAEHCDWNKLNGDNWSLLLRNNSEFSFCCEWNKFDGKNWYDLLRANTVFTQG